MKKRDNLIENGLVTIENKIKNLSKPDENYKFKTNCKFDNINIKTLTLQSLIAIFTELYIKKDALDKVYQKLTNLIDESDKTYLLYGFSINEWESDILYLIEKIQYNTKLKDLQEKSEALKKYYSEDKQADIAVQSILESI